MTKQVVCPKRCQSHNTRWKKRVFDHNYVVVLSRLSGCLEYLANRSVGLLGDDFTFMSAAINAG